MGVKLKVVSPDLFSHFMVFFNVLCYFQHFFKYPGGGVKKKNVFFF